MIRLRFVLSTSPRVNAKFERAPDALVSFAPMDALVDGLGGLDELETKAFSEIAGGSYNYFEDGDVLLAKVTPCFENGKKAIASNLENGAGFATSEVIVCRPQNNRLETRYLRYLFCSEDFRHTAIASMTGAGGLRRVSERALLDFPLHIPDLPTQRAIADFLDRETARIDSLIEKRRRFAALSEEAQQSLVAGMIFGGRLEQMEASSSDWTVALPKHWESERAKVHFRERIQKSTSGEEELLTVSHITGVTARAEKEVSMFLAESNEGYKIVCPGDIVINTMWGWMGAMGISSRDGIISPSYGVYRPISHAFEPEYLDLMLRSRPFIGEVTRRSKGIHSSRLRIYPDAFLDIRLPVPPREEQITILAGYHQRKERENTLLRKNEEASALLKEYRSALITSAVTGQIDVTTWSRAGTANRQLDTIQSEMRA